MSLSNQSVEFYQYKKAELRKLKTTIIVEAPVSLTVNGEIWLSFLCTPINLDALAVGFLFNEGYIDSDDEIVSTRVCPNNDNVDIWLKKSIDKPKNWRRTSGCAGGITSVEGQKDKQEITETQNKEVTHYPIIKAQKVTEFIEMLISDQDLYQSSGGVHTSILISKDKNIKVIAEDIGRHNTLDKIAGICLTKKIRFTDPILLTTGRISSDMMQKAIRMDASIVISRTSPSSLSVELAQKNGITLIGYARRNGFRLYSHIGRVYTK